MSTKIASDKLGSEALKAEAVEAMVSELKDKGYFAAVGYQEVTISFDAPLVGAPWANIPFATANPNPLVLTNVPAFPDDNF